MLDGLGAVRKKQKRYEPDNTVIIGLGAYALLFALGTAYRDILSIKAGPAGIEIVREVRKVGAEEMTAVRKAGEDAGKKLSARIDSLTEDLRKQTEASNQTLKQLSDLEKRLRFRRLSQQARSKFVALLRTAGKYTINEAGPAANDIEPTQFASEIISAIREAGWTVNTKTNFDDPMVGAVLGVDHDAKVLTPAEIALVQGLRDIGISPVKVEGGVSRLIIGVRPELPNK